MRVADGRKFFCFLRLSFGGKTNTKKLKKKKKVRKVDNMDLSEKEVGEPKRAYTTQFYK